MKRLFVILLLLSACGPTRPQQMDVLGLYYSPSDSSRLFLGLDSNRQWGTYGKYTLTRQDGNTSVGRWHLHQYSPGDCVIYPENQNRLDLDRLVVTIAENGDDGLFLRGWWGKDTYDDTLFVKVE